MWGVASLLGSISVILFLFCRMLLLRTVDVRKLCTIFFLYFLYIWLGIFHSESFSQSFLIFFRRYLPLLFIVLMTMEEQERLKNFTIKGLSLILAISIVAYIAWILGVQLPFSRIDHPTSSWYAPFFNYYFFITSINTSDFLRFRSVFTEPGHLGMICAIFLYINGYSLRRFQNLILLVALILSFSLAAYVLLASGWIIYQTMSGISFHKLLKSMFVAIFICGIGFIYLNSKSEENPFSVLILDRLVYDEDKGLSGDNRNTYDFMQTYKHLSFSEYLIGKGNSFIQNKFANTANSSYRNFILANGAIGLFFLFSFFFSVIYIFPSRLAIGLFLLYVISFIQRPYWLWEIESWMYLCAVPIFYKYKQVCD